MLVIAETSPLHYLVLIEHTAILPMLLGDVVIPLPSTLFKSMR